MEESEAMDEHDALAAAESAEENAEPVDGDAAVNDGAEDNTNAVEPVELIDVINQTLGQLLTKTQEEADAMAEAITKIREELEAAEAEAEKKVEQMETLREEAQAAADDTQWQTMYERLSVWSREKGHCNPRRNWKSKIDAEEKALGNWAGKQRMQEKKGQLNRFKTAALKRIGFVFDLGKAGWDDFHHKLKAFVAKNGRIPEKLGEMKESGLQNMISKHRNQPKQLLGLGIQRGPYKTKDRPQSLSPDKRVKNNENMRVKNNEAFTQERIDILTEAGLDWQLTAEHVNALKREKGLIFPMPKDEEKDELERGAIPTLMKHHWLQMFEALVEFKQKRGHCYVTPFNSTPELYHWVCQQRKRMKQPRRHKAKAPKEGFLEGYQAEMLVGLNFVYLKGDVEWMDNYERLKAYRRLFGIVALCTDKFCSFEHLEQWLEDNKREHLNLPKLTLHESVVWARRIDAPVSIPLTDRRMLLDGIGVFEVAIGEEEKAIRKSNYFFRTIGQILDCKHVVQSRKEMKDAEIMAKDPTPINGKREYTIDAATEKEFFLQHGAIVSASISGRKELKEEHSQRKYYDDGRPISLCRISNCFTSARSKEYNLCGRHFSLVEGFAKCEAVKERQIEESNKEATAKDDESGGNGESTNSNESKTVYSCSYCDKNDFESYEVAAQHQKKCGTVEEAKNIPPPPDQNIKPPWTDVMPISDKLQGEAKVLAKHYQFNIWKLAMDYRKKSNERPKKNQNIVVSAALGEERRRAPICEEEICFPVVKFPSMEDELESVKVFRRCCGPLAATFTGRKKLIREKQDHYGDGRPLRFCRVAGCQLVHSENVTKKLYLCDWHAGWIENPLDCEVNRRGKGKQEEPGYAAARKATDEYNEREDKKRKQAYNINKRQKVESEKAYNNIEKKKRKQENLLKAKFRKATKNYVEIRAAQKITLTAPEGRLGIRISNSLNSPGTVVTDVEKSSVLAAQILPGYHITAINFQDVSQMDVKEVESIMAKKINLKRILEFRTGKLASSISHQTSAVSHSVASMRGASGYTGVSHHPYGWPPPIPNAMFPAAYTAFASAMNPGAAHVLPYSAASPQATAASITPAGAVAKEMAAPAQIAKSPPEKDSSEIDVKSSNTATDLASKPAAVIKPGAQQDQKMPHFQNSSKSKEKSLA